MSLSNHGGEGWVWLPSFDKLRTNRCGAATQPLRGGGRT